MSKIDELLKNEKVEWRKLGEVFDTKVGYTPSKSNIEYWNNGNIPWFTIEDIRKNGKILYDAGIKISEKAVKKELFKANSIVFSIIGTIGEYALIKTDFIINQQFIVFLLKEKYQKVIDINFLRYYFYTFSNWSKLNSRKGNVPTIDTDRLLKLQIPIPSLETQEKIVKVLDKFTNYVTELQAELQARTKQYDYYRNLLLSEEYLSRYFDKNNVLEFKTIAEACYIENSARKAVAADLREKGEIAYYGANNIQDYVKGYTHNGEYILIAEDGSRDLDDYSIQYVVGKFWANNHVHVVRAKEGLLNRYLYYFLKETNFKPYLSSLTRSKLTKENLMKINIKVPPFNIQQIVVNILDKYQELLSDTKGLLPQEIKQRQKQYEYYREKLLTFDIEGIIPRQTDR